MEIINTRKLRELRLARGWTQEELGKISGVQRATISKIETGARSNIRSTTLTNLAKALGVPADELLLRPPMKLQDDSSEYLDVFRAVQAAMQNLSEEQLHKLLDYVRYLHAKRQP